MQQPYRAEALDLGTRQPARGKKLDRLFRSGMACIEVLKQLRRTLLMPWMKNLFPPQLCNSCWYAEPIHRYGAIRGHGSWWHIVTEAPPRVDPEWLEDLDELVIHPCFRLRFELGESMRRHENGESRVIPTRSRARRPKANGMVKNADEPHDG